MSCTIIKLSDDGRVYVIEEEGAVIREKQVDPDALLDLIKNSVYNEVIDSWGNVLPKNCIYYGVVERRSGSPLQVVVLEREKRILPYNHFGTTEIVGYPKLLFAYKVDRTRIVSSAVVAAVDEIITENSPVYHFPYANVFKNGVFCTGTYHYPEIKSLADLTYLPEDFYMIEHTHETNALGERVRDILDRVKGKPFDDELLRFMSTFGQFIETFMRY